MTDKAITVLKGTLKEIRLFIIKSTRDYSFTINYGKVKVQNVNFIKNSKKKHPCCGGMRRFFVPEEKSMQIHDCNHIFNSFKW